MVYTFVHFKKNAPTALSIHLGSHHADKELQKKNNSDFSLYFSLRIINFSLFILFQSAWHLKHNVQCIARM